MSLWTSLVCCAAAGLGVHSDYLFLKMNGLEGLLLDFWCRLAAASGVSDRETSWLLLTAAESPIMSD